MGYLKEKSGFNIDSAQELIDKSIIRETKCKKNIINELKFLIKK